MTPSQILLYALLLVLIYLIYKYLFTGSSNTMTALLTAETPYVVSEDALKVINGGQPVFNYTVSIWIYIDNWEVNASLKKRILTIPNALDIYLGTTDNTLFVDVYPFGETASSASASFTKDSYTNLSPIPYEALTSRDKKIKDRFKEPFYGKVSRSAIEKKASGKEPFADVAASSANVNGLNVIPFANSMDTFTASVPSIPLQTWTNITVGIHDKAIDIYINGKLTQSNLFPFVPSPVKNSMTITPDHGFKGWTSNFQYYPYNLTPSKIEEIYQKGYSGSAENLLSLLGKYSMKIVFVDNTQQQ
jgi:hypothetical protein